MATIKLDQSVFDAVDEDWQGTFGEVHGDNEIVEHIAWNMIANRLPLSKIDGWADKPDYYARLRDEAWSTPMVVVETTMP